MVEVTLQAIRTAAPVQGLSQSAAAGTTNVPQAITALASGATLAGFVLNRDTQGNPVLRTELGDFLIKTPLFLKIGSDVVVRVSNFNNTTRTTIVSVNGQPPAALPATPTTQPEPVDAVAVQSALRISGNVQSAAPSTVNTNTAAAVARAPEAPLPSTAINANVVSVSNPALAPVFFVPGAPLAVRILSRLNPEQTETADAPEEPSPVTPAQNKTGTSPSPQTAPSTQPPSANTAMQPLQVAINPAGTAPLVQVEEAGPAMTSSPASETDILSPSATLAPKALPGSIQSNPAVFSPAPAPQSTLAETNRQFVPAIAQTHAHPTLPQADTAVVPQHTATAPSAPLHQQQGVITNTSSQTSPIASSSSQAAFIPEPFGSPQPSTVPAVETTSSSRPPAPFSAFSLKPLAPAPLFSSPAADLLKADTPLSTIPPAANVTKPITPQSAVPLEENIPTVKNTLPDASTAAFTSKPLISGNQQAYAAYYRNLSSTFIPGAQSYTGSKVQGINTPIEGMLTAINVTATVVRREIAGLLLQTDFGSVHLQARPNIAAGTQISISLLPENYTDPESITSPSIAALARKWESLAHIIDLLHIFAPDEALALEAKFTQLPLSNTAAHTPQARFALAHAGIFGFLSTLLKEDGRNSILSKSASDTLEAKGYGALLKRAESEFGAMRQWLQDPQLPWQAFFVPVMAGGEMSQLRFYKRRKRESDAKKASEDSRFIVEADLSALGGLQLDGLVQHQKQGTRFDLVIRSHDGLPETIQHDIISIYRAASEATGYFGIINFEQTEHFPIHPLEDILAQQHSLVVA